MRLFTCIHGRRDLTRAFFWHLQDLRERTSLDLPINVCYSDKEDFEAVEEFIREQDSIIQYSNNLLGDKWNYLVANMIKTHPSEKYMSLGSDDFISAEYIMKANDYDGQFAGTADVYFYNMFTDKAISFSYVHPICKTLGAGRVFSHSLLHDVYLDSNLWNPMQQQGLDNYSEKFLYRRYGIKPDIISFNEPQIVDVKTYENIHKFEEYEERGQELPSEKVLSLMPKVSFA